MLEKIERAERATKAAQVQAYVAEHTHACNLWRAVENALKGGSFGNWTAAGARAMWMAHLQAARLLHPAWNASAPCGECGARQGSNAAAFEGDTTCAECTAFCAALGMLPPAAYQHATALLDAEPPAAGDVVEATAAALLAIAERTREHAAAANAAAVETLRHAAALATESRLDALPPIGNKASDRLETYALAWQWAEDAARAARQAWETAAHADRKAAGLAHATRGGMTVRPETRAAVEDLERRAHAFAGVARENRECAVRSAHSLGMAWCCADPAPCTCGGLEVCCGGAE